MTSRPPEVDLTSSYLNVLRPPGHHGRDEYVPRNYYDEASLRRSNALCRRHALWLRWKEEGTPGSYSYKDHYSSIHRSIKFLRNCHRGLIRSGVQNNYQFARYLLTCCLFPITFLPPAESLGTIESHYYHPVARVLADLPRSLPLVSDQLSHSGARQDSPTFISMLHRITTCFDDLLFDRFNNISENSVSDFLERENNYNHWFNREYFANRQSTTSQPPTTTPDIPFRLVTESNIWRPDTNRGLFSMSQPEGSDRADISEERPTGNAASVPENENLQTRRNSANHRVTHSNLLSEPGRVTPVKRKFDLMDQSPETKRVFETAFLHALPTSDQLDAFRTVQFCLKLHPGARFDFALNSHLCCNLLLFSEVDFSSKTVSGNFICKNKSAPSLDFIAFLLGVKRLVRFFPPSLSDVAKKLVILERMLSDPELSKMMKVEAQDGMSSRSSSAHFTGSIIDFSQSKLNRRHKGTPRGNSLSLWMRLQPWSQFKTAYSLACIFRMIEELRQVEETWTEKRVTAASELSRRYAVSMMLISSHSRVKHVKFSSRNAAIPDVYEDTVSKMLSDALASKKNSALVNIQLNYIFFEIELDVHQVLNDKFDEISRMLGSQGRNDRFQVYKNLYDSTRETEPNHKIKLLASLNRKAGSLELYNPLNLNATGLHRTALLVRDMGVTVNQRFGNALRLPIPLSEIPWTFGQRDCSDEEDHKLSHVIAQYSLSCGNQVFRLI